MVLVAPNVVGLVFANRVLIDPKAGEISLIGIFQNKAFSSFPTAPIEMVAFIMVSGGRGEGGFELTVCSLDEFGEHEPGDWIYRKRMLCVFPQRSKPGCQH